MKLHLKLEAGWEQAAEERLKAELKILYSDVIKKLEKLSAECFTMQSLT